MATRREHVQWCKRRAIPYADAGDLRQARDSMISDMTKNDETRAFINSSIGLHLIEEIVAMVKAEDKQGVLDWINGFQ